ncbi:ABC transporter ATP-binding protein [Stackebrandtia nassauensis]|uniref:ABC transporter related protein n=1 Tax=Stackebrandtia nassauensis (strain DSM 44728 / CIP 108903 / NRRL B-16338 / NBRC 102104 / LLR-40K-21) TaxID=446470 RepID=D3PVR2_STANL|nr:ABC transporter ATP-binding protein [Stackebrandtia nassauensis]ADD43176.1 ABC transporter related protein [Stackebrandtia nassauensis DSM 44728]
MNQPVLSIRDLSVAFRTNGSDVTAVNGVSLDVPQGHTVAVVGESGSGKSTTAAAVNRLLPANGRITSGQVLFKGEDLADLSERRMRAIRGAGIGLVPQDPMSNLNPLLRVGDQVAEALEVHDRAHGRTAHARAVELLDSVGIPDAERRARQYPHEFSGGMRQRVLIAMGLACEPSLLIADEPTSALDVTLQRRILDQLDTLTTNLGTSVLLITHDLALAAERADTVAVMYHGEIVESGGAQDILADPQHEYTRRLLAAAPSLTSATTVAGPLEPEARPDATDLITVDKLTKRFPIRASGSSSEFTAVDEVGFTIPRGHTVSIVGESGSGKSTTANLILGLEKPSSGSIAFEGADITTMNQKETFALRRRVQPVFQNPYASLDPRYTVEQSIAEPLRVHRVGDKKSRHDTVVKLLDQVALPSTMAERLPHELSGGQRQRVAIARAIALSPDLVVLDEAVSALDVLVQAQILELLSELQRELGLSYLFISHDLAVVRLISHAVHVMRDGRIVESGTPQAIFANPQDDYTRELLAAIPGAGLAT